MIISHGSTNGFKNYFRYQKKDSTSLIEPTQVEAVFIETFR